MQGLYRPFTALTLGLRERESGEGKVLIQPAFFTLASSPARSGAYYCNRASARVRIQGKLSFS